LDKLEGYERTAPPAYLRFGLYAGDDLSRPLRITYLEALERRFKRPVVAALENDLRTFSNNPAPGPADLKANYDRLKAYLMLGPEKKRAESGFLEDQLLKYWQERVPPATQSLAQQQLAFFCRQVSRAEVNGINYDASLLESVRSRLSEKFSPKDRVYRSILSRAEGKTTSVKLPQVLQGLGANELAALTGTATVPGSFTLQGYRAQMRDELKNASADISSEDWVFGGSGGKATDSELRGLQDDYFRDYADAWHRFLQGVKVKSFSTKDEAVQVLKGLAARNSPLEKVLRAAADNTHFSAPPPKPVGWVDWFRSFFRSSDTDDGLTGKSKVEDDFKPLIKLVKGDYPKAEGNKTSAVMGQYLDILSKVQRDLEGVSNDEFERVSQEALTGKNTRLNLTLIRSDVEKLLETVDVKKESDAGRLLLEPFINLQALQAKKGIGQTEKAWQQLLPKAQRIEISKPPVSELESYLSPVNGAFSVFYRDQLANYFEGTPGQLRLKATDALRLSPEFVAYVNNALTLREALFPNNSPKVQLTYRLELQNSNAGDVRLEVDGTTLEVTDAPKEGNFKWPGEVNTGSGAVLRVFVPNEEARTQTYTGEWAVFDLYAAGGPQPQPDKRVALQWMVGGVPVRARLTPNSGVNLFDRTLFTRLKAPRSTGLPSQ
jgi:type VI secretion system protein ImpL